MCLLSFLDRSMEPRNGLWMAKKTRKLNNQWLDLALLSICDCLYLTDNLFSLRWTVHLFCCSSCLIRNKSMMISSYDIRHINHLFIYVPPTEKTLIVRQFSQTMRLIYMTESCVCTHWMNCTDGSTPNLYAHMIYEPVHTFTHSALGWENGEPEEMRWQ